MERFLYKIRLSVNILMVIIDLEILCLMNNLLKQSHIQVNDHCWTCSSQSLLSFQLTLGRGERDREL